MTETVECFVSTKGLDCSYARQSVVSQQFRLPSPPSGDGSYAKNKR